MRDSHQEFVDYYRVLGVSPDASHREIREAYRREAMRWHPDRNASDDAAGRMRMVNEAWGVLGEPEGRSKFDYKRDSHLRERSASSDGSSGTNSKGAPFTESSATTGRAAGIPAHSVVSEYHDRSIRAGVWFLVIAIWIGLFALVSAAAEIDRPWFVVQIVFLVVSMGLLVALYVFSRNEGENSLHRLIWRGQVEAWEVEALLESGASPSARDSIGQTPLTVAVKAGASADVLRLLATSEAVARSRSALFWLIKKDFGIASEGSQIQTLIDAGILDRVATSPWRWLIALARILRNADIDTNETLNRYRGLELHVLLSRHHVQYRLVDALVRGGACLKAEDSHGCTPIEIALEMRHPRAIVELLAP